MTSLTCSGLNIIIFIEALLIIHDVTASQSAGQVLLMDLEEVMRGC